MDSARALACLAVVTVCAAPAAAQAPSAAGRHIQGYLAPNAIPDTFAVLPPPPTPGDTKEDAERADHDAYVQTRKLQGTPRWELAARDAVQTAPAVAADFDCALGADLTPQSAPATLNLLARVRADASAITNFPKDRFQHPRPFVSYGGPICTEADRKGLAASWSYPSGHTTMSWAYGLILAELAPTHATDILSRARAYGESRVVCGVHTVSDIETGRVNGSVLVAALHADPTFRADMDAARAELAALLAHASGAPAERQCAVERDAMVRTPWLPEKKAAPAVPGPPKAAN
jgi:acid phosphatase (class A)